MGAGRAAAAAAEQNAELMRRQAARELEIGQLNARRIRDRGESLAATQRSLLAAGGGDPSSGSALLIQENLAQETEFNAQLAKNNAAMAASTKNAQAVIARAEGRSASTASLFRTGTSLLGTAEKFRDFG
jgi:hypothetical protein